MRKPLSTEDYNKYLAKVYSAGDFKKPRDAIGLAKTLPPDEMKKLILDNTPVTDQNLQHLADARANAVRAYLSEQAGGFGADVHNRAEAGRDRDQGSGQDDARRSVAGVSARRRWRPRVK